MSLWLVIQSTEARIEERYTRTGPDTIELRMTLYDPKFYKAPWVCRTSRNSSGSSASTRHFRWYGLFSGLTDGICAPMNEVDTYNKLFRDPTSKGGGRK